MTAQLRDSLAQVQELKSCPFCGGDPIMWAATDCKDGFVHGTTINCPACGISINDEYRDAAITAWNTRPALLARQEGEDARDAARYRWLRANPNGTRFRVPCPDSIPTCKVGHRGPCLMGEELDAAIDAARSGGGG